MNQDILIFAEQQNGQVQNLSLELVQGSRTYAAALGGRVVSVLPGYRIEKAAAQLIEAGADEVLAIDDPALARYRPSYYTAAAACAVKETEPALMLFGSSSIGLETAARTAGRMNAGLAADCTGIHIDPDTRRIFLTRPNADGISIDTFVFREGSLKIAAVRPGVLALPRGHAAFADTRPRQGVIRPAAADFSAVRSKARILSVSNEKKPAADITQARVLAAGGRGIGGPDGFRLLCRIAKLLGGETACSRACVESGWADASRQVGQTGRTVRPELYLACGISGAFQHVAGMKDSRFIISINKNPAAPIFAVSDLGIAGSTEVILPALLRALEDYTGAGHPAE